MLSTAVATPIGISSKSGSRTRAVVRRTILVEADSVLVLHASVTSEVA